MAIKYYLWKINTHRVLIWRLILDKYVPEVEYTQCKKNVGEYALSLLTNNGYQNTTQESNYIMENMSEINDIEEIYEGTFTINFKIIYQHHRK